MPDSITVRLLMDGAQVEGLWVRLSLVTTRNNDFSSGHGPSDPTGLVTIKALDVLRRAQLDQAMFPMDYGTVEADWDGTLELRVMNLAAMEAAIEAVETWGEQAWAYRRDVRDGLQTALTKLADCEGASLTVEPVKVPGDLTVLPESTQA
jgi:hypothetical protein